MKTSRYTRRDFLGLASAGVLAGAFPGARAALAQQHVGQNSWAIGPSWRIVTPAKPHKTETFAAEELQLHLHKITGWELPITASGATGLQEALLVGRHPQLAAVAKKLDEEYGREPDAFAIVGKGQALGFIGSSQIATANAVWHWLESLGVRWFFPTEKGEYIPRLAGLGFQESESYFKPHSYMRRIWPWAVNRQGSKEFFGAREHGVPAWRLHQLRLMGWPDDNPVDAFDGIENVGHGHSYYQYLSGEKYFDEHPEWFNLVGGRRRKIWTDGAQVCFTNQEAAREYAGNVKKAIQGSWRDPRRMMVWCSPNDTWAICECENCQKLLDKDGSATSMVFHFANLVTRELNKDYPDLKVLCYAYLNHSTPPDHITLEPNVTPILTYWTGSMSFHVNNTRPAISPENKKFLDAYHRWNELCKDFGIYQYYGHFNWFTPFPMQTQMDNDLKILSKNPQYRGFICEYHSNWGTQAYGMYLLAKLGFNADLNADEILRDYCEKAYGPAHQAMHRYYTTLQNAMDTTTYISGEQWEVHRMLRPAVIATCNQCIAEVESKFDAMDDGTRWRSEFACRAWHLSATLAEAMQRYSTGTSVADAQFIRQKLQQVRDVLDSDWGVLMLDDTTNLPDFNRFSPGFMVPIEQLPPGKHRFANNMNMGGLIKMHGQLENLTPGDWGYSLAAGAKGLARLPLKAAPGHSISTLKVRWRSHGTNKNIEEIVTVSSKQRTHRFPDAAAMDKDLTVPSPVLGAEELTIELQLTNNSPDEQLCLYAIELETTVV